MKIKRYFAEDMRAALRKVREAQGPDAVILSNRKVDGGIEIVAAVDYDEALLQTPAEPEPGDRTPAPGPGTRREPPGAAQSAGPEMVWSREPSIEALYEELGTIRELLEHQLSGLAWGELGRREPQRAALLRRLLRLDLHPDLAREIAARVPREASGRDAWRKALGVLAHEIRVVEDPILDHGGVVALVGPTGVGKTTTVAKLAARFALTHGPERVALLTTDAYRVGALEQLRTYARIMGVPVRLTRDAEELQGALDDFLDRDLVLIDTAGMGQRDVRLSSQLATVRSGAPRVRSYLALSATTQGAGAREAIQAFRDADLEGCILTKIDEATGLGQVLSTLIQERLPVAYVSTGQQVPEDLHPARAHGLISQAVGIAQRQAPGQEEALAERAYGGMAANGRI